VMFVRKIIRRLYPAWVLFTLKIRYLFLGFDNVNCYLSQCESRVLPAALRLFGADIGEETVFEFALIINTDATIKYQNLRVGNRCHIGKNVLLDLKGKIFIGDNVTISMGSSVISHFDAGRSGVSAFYPVKIGEVYIGSNCYLGANSTILMGVRVDECCVVGAGAVITKNIPSNTVVAGVPAKVIKKTRK